MQDRLREIEGTLARTKERKNTILYKLAKRRQEEERLALLGLQRLPTNPHQVEDVKVVKHVLFRLKQEIGDKIAHLRDSKLSSIDKDGEAVIRAKNDEINKLISRKNQWEVRLAVLSDKEAPAYTRRKLYFGCAKDLPEAEASRKRPREKQEKAAGESTAASSSEDDAGDEFVLDDNEEEDDDAITQDADYTNRVSWLGSASADAELLREEREAEAKFRATLDFSSKPTTSKFFVKSYCEDGKLTIPSEEEFKNALVAKRKELLQERLKAMRNKK